MMLGLVLMRVLWTGFRRDHEDGDYIGDETREEPGEYDDEEPDETKDSGVYVEEFS